MYIAKTRWENVPSSRTSMIAKVGFVDSCSERIFSERALAEMYRISAIEVIVFLEWLTMPNLS